MATTVNRSKIVINKGIPGGRTPRAITTGPIHYYYDDPTTPELSAKVEIGSSPLPVAIQGYLGGGQQEGSLAWQAATSAITIGTSLKYAIAHSKKAITHWTATNVLMVMVRAGEDLNAYYDRQALRFFYIKDPVTHKVVFACDGASVVAHELGHAILDILRPDFWNTQALEVFAFHEAFGDCNAVLTIMQHDAMLERMLNETEGDLTKSNVVSRLAKQMGAAAYHMTPPEDGFSPDYLRNAANNFKYVKPETLPEETPDNVLSKECHNFSRVWTGAWYEFMAKLQKKLSAAMDPMSATRTARDIAADYLFAAVADVPLAARLFDALARQMLVVDGLNGGMHRDVLLEVFNERDILQNKVTAMASMSLEELASTPHAHLKEYSDGSSLYVRKNALLKIEDHVVAALSEKERPNPLYAVKIKVPMESVYHFDGNGVMINFHETDEDEAIQSARHCLDYLNNHHLVSRDEKTPFEVKEGFLTRTHACGACNCHRNNACDPNAPEYHKGYKGGNNAGCGCKGCGNVPVCDCEDEEPRPRPKLGCVTKVKNGNVTRVSGGYNASTKAC